MVVAIPGYIHWCTWKVVWDGWILRCQSSASCESPLGWLDGANDYLGVRTLRLCVWWCNFIRHQKVGVLKIYRFEHLHISNLDGFRHFCHVQLKLEVSFFCTKFGRPDSSVYILEVVWRGGGFEDCLPNPYDVRWSSFNQPGPRDLHPLSAKPPHRSERVFRVPSWLNTFYFPTAYDWNWLNGFVDLDSESTNLLHLCPHTLCLGNIFRLM